MLGRLCRGKERTVQLRAELILGLPVLTLELPERARRPEWTLIKGAGLLRKQRVSHVLTPPDFEGWSVLEYAGLHPVNTRALRCALAPVWVQQVLKSKGIPLEQAILSLKGEREEPDMERVARMLCPLVRNLIIDVPQKGDLARNLRWEFGMPILPAGSGENSLTLAFDSGPILPGIQLELKKKELPKECERLPLLSVLWENGRVKMEEIIIQVDFS